MADNKYQRQLDALVEARFDNAEVWASDVRHCIAAPADAEIEKLAAEVSRLRASLKDAKINLLMLRNYLSNTRPNESEGEVEVASHAMAEEAAEQGYSCARAALATEQPMTQERRSAPDAGKVVAK